MLSAGGLEGVLDESGEALALADGLQVYPDVHPGGQGGVGRPGQDLPEMGVADEPDGHQIAAVEGEVHERAEVAKELLREILRLIDIC